MDSSESQAVAGWQVGLHLLIANALVVAQPLLQLLRGQAEFLVAHDLDSAQVRWLVMVVMLLPPAILIVLRGLLARAPHALRLAFDGSIVSLFAILFLLQLVKVSGLDALGAGRLLVLVCLVAGCALGWLYLGSKLVRSFMTLLSPALIAVPLLFLLDTQVQKLGSAATDGPQDLPAITTPHPVVFVIFDELGSTPLVDAEGRFNSRRVPNLSALAESSYWFANATTTSCVTVKAVPAILSGVLPRDGQMPVLADHPINLFTLLEGQYDIVARENATRLAPESVDLPPPSTGPHSTEPPSGELSSSRATRWTTLAMDLAIVYGHVIAPRVLAQRLPPIDQGWGGFVPPQATGRGETRLLEYRAFLDSIEARDDPTLYYHHILLPHLPFSFVPSGKSLVRDRRGDDVPPQNRDRGVDDDALIRAYKRYLFQVELVDGLVGELVSRLEQQDLFDRSIIIITGDHGYRSMATSRPEVRAAAEAGCLFVPLIVKLPLQTEGIVVSKPVSTIDILPTLVELLGIDPVPTFEGTSLLSTDVDHRIELFKDGDLVPIDLELHAVKSRLSGWINEYFGQGEDPSEIFRAGSSLPNLIGKPRQQLEVVYEPGIRIELDPDTTMHYDPTGDWVPSLVRGNVTFDQPPREPHEVVVLINGVVEGTAPTYEVEKSRHRFVVTIPEERFLSGENQIEILLASRNHPEVLLEAVGGT